MCLTFQAVNSCNKRVTISVFSSSLLEKLSNLFFGDEKVKQKMNRTIENTNYQINSLFGQNSFTRTTKQRKYKTTLLCRSAVNFGQYYTTRSEKIYES